jgi:hypothetical protein
VRHLGDVSDVLRRDPKEAACLGTWIRRKHLMTGRVPHVATCVRIKLGHSCLSAHKHWRPTFDTVTPPSSF